MMRMTPYAKKLYGTDSCLGNGDAIDLPEEETAAEAAAQGAAEAAEATETEAAGEASAAEEEETKEDKDAAGREKDPARIRMEDVAVKLIRYDDHALLLSSVPHARFLDLAVIFLRKLPGGPGKAYRVITNDDLRRFELRYRDLLDHAVHGISRELPPVCTPLDKMLGIERGEDDPPVYVLTNPEGIYGASVILYPETKDVMRKLFPGDVFLLPCSVHELLLLPAGGEEEKANLEKIVKEINGSVLSEEEFLSDTVYRFRRRSGTFSM